MKWFKTKKDKRIEELEQENTNLRLDLEWESKRKTADVEHLRAKYIIERALPLDVAEDLATRAIVREIAEALIERGLITFTAETDARQNFQYLQGDIKVQKAR